MGFIIVTMVTTMIIMIIPVQVKAQDSAVQKDTVYNFPTNAQALEDMCNRQTTNTGIDPKQYCGEIILHKCQLVQLTPQECYAQFFVVPGVAPQEILQSARDKFKAAGIDPDQEL